MKSNSSKKGFTLIELLVVVLIIGVLAAIALPQFQKAVWKSRAAELITQARNVYNAQQIYFTEHGKFADSFDLLSIDFKGLTRAPAALLQQYGVEDGYLKGNGDIMVYLHPNPGDTQDWGSSGAVFGTGPYAMCGFLIHNQGGSNYGVYHEQGQMLCMERTAESTGFCEKMFKGTPSGSGDGNRYYAIP